MSYRSSVIGRICLVCLVAAACRADEQRATETTIELDIGKLHKRSRLSIKRRDR